MTSLSEIARALGGKINGQKAICRCPAHDDRTPSLSIEQTAQGKLLVKCHAGCTQDAVIAALEARGLWPKHRPNGKAKEVRRMTFDFRCPRAGKAAYRKIRIEYDDRSKFIRFCGTGYEPVKKGEDGRAGSTPLLYGGERIADLAEGQPVWIVEGEKQVERLRALGVIAVSGDTGEGSKWLPRHAELLRGLDIILWPDSDEPGEKYIAAAARCLQGHAASLHVVRPFGLPNGSKGLDVCDWSGDAEALARLIESAEPYVPPAQTQWDQSARGKAETPQKRKMAIEWFDEAADSALAEPTAALIQDLLDQGALSIIYGDSGSGKTFAVLDLGFHVATGREWNGRCVKRGLVVFVAAEGGKRIRRRLAALKKRYQDAPKPLFALVRHPIDLRSCDADLNELLALVRTAEAEVGEKCVWLIVDTLSRAMAGGDENSPKDMGLIVAAADRFRAEIGAHFTYVHHSGKDQARGARGHSLLRAATDTEIETTATAMTATKQRDMESDFTIGFELVDIPLGNDPNGDPIKSAVVEWKPGQGKVNGTAAKVGRPNKSLNLLMEALKVALDEAGAEIKPFADGPKIRAVSEKAVRLRFDVRMAEWAEPAEDPAKLAKRQCDNFRNAVNRAVAQTDIRAAPWKGERWLWLP